MRWRTGKEKPRTGELSGGGKVMRDAVKTR